MKKIFTLAIASLMTLSMFAADRKPSVTLTTTKKFEVVIDGRSYASAIGTTMNVAGMYSGRHTIKVYALKNGFFSRQKQLVSTSTFQLSRNDVNISVDRSGSINVQEERNFRDDRNDSHGWNNGQGKDDSHDNRGGDSHGGNRH
jgi:hypothetical protein